ncbi:MAG: FAD-dependent oxidoreductase [Schleiferiaceae bacterium]|nr:FAD-dependent oxidoreductase [Schleiferiaceae bacterium]
MKVPTATPIDIRIPAQDYESEGAIKKAISEHIGKKVDDISSFEILKRSIDARSKTIFFQLRIAYSLKGMPIISKTDYSKSYPTLDNKAPHGVIIGAGPAGIFAALKLIENGIRPIVIERGKDVRSRRRDLAKIHKEHLVNEDSNYCFGEGGAGTYSDGKLYTRSGKRGSIQEVLELFVNFGADADILVDAHPHIGTNKLPKIIAAMREQIIACGGEVFFETKLTDIIYTPEKQIDAIEVIHKNEKRHIATKHIILATGHSARDIFELLNNKKIFIEFKTFALGVRAEHPQQLIDHIQYKRQERPSYLPPAAYSLVTQVKGKGVYSFCMCPGGIIAPCATNPGEIVTNGWSPSKRNNPFANSGIVTTIDDDILHEFDKSDPLRGMKFQQQIEQLCWALAGKTQRAPAQRIIDFIAQRKSKDLPDCSYQPGLVSVEMDEIFPPAITARLRSAFIEFGKKMKGYLHPDAIVVATESRTSSPVRIPRDSATLEHPEVKGLYPCGEGAGYAGGIVSAAIDGQNCAMAIVNSIKERTFSTN